ncbi:MAG: response regulator [Labilithrix sp.]|nr:response regulator [Labilithrix sp.]MCW5813040.1 response regulator [Labilithrix sp.]
MSAPRVLIVDDDARVLESLGRVLRGSFDVITASSGAAGLEALAKDPTVAAVVSDMRMPLMSGAAFLAEACALHPDATRLLLTGESDLDDAIAAVNQGHIFRFLRKPCAPADMRAALLAAAEQNRLVRAERELLEQTLRGAVHALTEALAITSPTVFGAATRVKQNACAMAAKLGLASTWKLEIAAMLCQLGALSLPAGVYERRALRETLGVAEVAMLERVPVLTEQLLAPIPRLEPIVSIIRHALAGPCVCELEADILRAALDFEEHEEIGSTKTALAAVRGMETRHRPEVVDALAAVFFGAERAEGEISIAALKEGMVIAADVRTTTGILVVARGHTITEALVERLRNYVPVLPSGTVRVAA